MVTQKLRVVQSNEMGFPSIVDDECLSGLKSLTAKEEKTQNTLRKTLFILKRRDGFRDFAVLDSVYDHYRDEDRKYALNIFSIPIVLCDQALMVHLISRNGRTPLERRMRSVDLNLGCNRYLFLSNTPLFEILYQGKVRDLSC